MITRVLIVKQRSAHENERFFVMSIIKTKGSGTPPEGVPSSMAVGN